MEMKILKYGKIRTIASVLAIVMFVPLLCGSLVAEEGYKLYVSHPEYFRDNKASVSVMNFDSSLLVDLLYTNPGCDLLRYHEKLKRLFVISSSKGVCEVYDPVVDRKLYDFSTGGRVADIAFSPSGRTMYVANGSYDDDYDNSVQLISTADGAQLYSLTVGRNPVAVEVSPDGKLLYVADRFAGVVNVIDIVNYQVLRSFYAGVNPTDLELSWDGRYLITASASLSGQDKTGGGIALVNLGTESVSELVRTDGDILQLLTVANNRLICLINDEPGYSALIYDLIADKNSARLALVRKIPLAGKVTHLTVTPNRQFLLAADAETGTVRKIDLVGFGEVGKFEKLGHKSMGQIALVSVDFASQIAARDSIIDQNPEGESARQAYFEKAYLYRCRGDKNSEVKIYTDLAEAFSGTKTEILSWLRLGDLCYHDLLYANSADFYTRGFKAYASYLNRSGDPDSIPMGLLRESMDNLGRVSLELKQDHLEKVFSEMEALSQSGYQLAEMYFLLAYYLKKQGETRASRRALDEAERQLIHFTDRSRYNQLKNKIDLLSENSRVVAKARKLKKSPLIDGKLSEWDDKTSLYLDRRENLLVNEMRWADERDLSIDTRVAFDRDNLYLGAIVYDNMLFADTDKKRDQLRLYLDLRDRSGEFINRERLAGDNLFVFEIIPPEGDDSTFSFSSPEGVSPIFAARKTETGYSLEIQIPLVYLNNFDPKQRETIGYGLELWDVDNDQTGNPVKIMGWVAPASSIEGDRDYRMLGILKFD